VYGTAINSPFPKALDGSLSLNSEDNYLLEDVDNTEEYASFEAWVLALAFAPIQARVMGSVVQGTWAGLVFYRTN
jgi:hypothetical protein